MSNIKDVRCKPRLGISWSMAAMLRDVVVGRTRPRSLTQAMLTMKKELNGFLFHVLFLVIFLLWTEEAPFLKLV